MSNKKDIQEMLISMEFQPNYIQRAFKIYEKNYGQSYNFEVLTEIIVRLQQIDKPKQFKRTINKLKWKWTNYESKGSNSFYACIAKEIFGKKDENIQLKINNDIYQYIIKSKDNEEYFDKLFKKFNKNTHYVEIIAVSELYNVRIIAFEYALDLKVIYEAFKCYVSCINIPLILLSNYKDRNDNEKWGIIHDLDDIAHLVAPNTNLADYLHVIEKQKSSQIIVGSLCNYWMNIQLKMDQYIPNPICDVMVKFMPKFNVRPIIGEYKQSQDHLYWNEQMKNKRNEILSYIHL